MEDKIGLGWRKSSYSGNGGGNCVEVASRGSSVLVRDTRQDRADRVLRFSPAAWRRFADRVKHSLAPDLESEFAGACEARSRARGMPLSVVQGHSSPGDAVSFRSSGSSGCWFPPVPGIGVVFESHVAQGGPPARTGA